MGGAYPKTMEKQSRLLFFLLIPLLLMCSLSANGERVEQGLFVWELSDEVIDDNGTSEPIATLRGYTSRTDGPTELVIPQSVAHNGITYRTYRISISPEEYGKDGYAWLKNVTKITLPEGLCVLDATGFQWLYSLKEINLPESVSYVGTGTLLYSSVENDVKNSRIFVAAATNKEGTCVIQEGTTTILPLAFCNFYISEEEDRFIRKYSEVSVPSTISNIPERCFLNNEYVSKVYLSEGLSSIAKNAFEGCHALSEINFPSTLSEIDSFAFSNCYSLKSVALPPLKMGVTAFFNSGVTDLSFEEGTTCVFNNMFKYCENLVNVTLPSTLKVIQAYAFANCKNLRSINIPAEVETIDTGAFSDCNESLRFDVDEANEHFTVRGGILVTKGETPGIISWPLCVNEFTILPGDVFPKAGTYKTWFADFMSRYGTRLKVLNVNYPFSAGMVSGRGWLKRLFAVFTNEVYGGSITCNVPITLTTLNLDGTEYSDFCHYEDNKEYRIQSTNIHELGLNGNSISAYYKANSYHSNDVRYDKHLSYFFPNVQTVRIGAASIEPAALGDMSAIKEVYTNMAGPGHVGGASNFGAFFDEGTSFDAGFRAVTQQLEDGASHTYGVPVSLEYVELSQGVEVIPYGAFYNVSMVKEIHLPSSLIMVGDKAFYGCAGLQHLYLDSAEPPVAFSSSFDGMRLTSCVLHVPAGCAELYKAAEGWKRFYNIEEEAELKVYVTKNIREAGVVFGINAFKHGETAHLKAAANRGYDFVGWYESGRCVYPGEEYQFTVNRSTHLTAMFAPRNNDNDVVVETEDDFVNISFPTVADATEYIITVFRKGDDTPIHETSIKPSAQQRAPNNSTANLSARFNMDWLAGAFYNYSIEATHDSGILSQWIGGFNRYYSAIEDVETNGKPYDTLKNGILITADIADLTILSLDGRIHFRGSVQTGQRITLLPGVYVIRTVLGTEKIAVKGQ